MRVFRLATHSTCTSPPRPPSPPSGPPNSMNFSRRKLTAPPPPSPLRIQILASSRKRIALSDPETCHERKRGKGGPSPPSQPPWGRRYSDGGTGAAHAEGP